MKFVQILFFICDVLAILSSDDRHPDCTVFALTGSESAQSTKLARENPLRCLAMTSSSRILGVTEQ